jgi:hypothetical protein
MYETLQLIKCSHAYTEFVGPFNSTDYCTSLTVVIFPASVVFLEYTHCLIFLPTWYILENFLVECMFMQYSDVSMNSVTVVAQSQKIAAQYGIIYPSFLFAVTIYFIF